MTTRKVCLLGAVAVGKTSLVRRFVEGVFSERYLTTVGVKIDKKTVDLETGSVSLIIWDLAGEDEFAQLQTTYLRGAAAYIIVVDPTRPETLEKAIELENKAQQVLGQAPHVVVFNKVDLTDQWRVDGDAIASLENDKRMVVRTSAKTGQGVEILFVKLAQLLWR